MLRFGFGDIKISLFSPPTSSDGAVLSGGQGLKEFKARRNNLCPADHVEPIDVKPNERILSRVLAHSVCFVFF